MSLNPKDNIRQLMADNKTDEVIKALRELSNQAKSTKISDAIIIISARYQNFVDEKITGTVDSNESATNLNKLNQAILNLLEEIPEEALETLPNTPKSTSSHKEVSKDAFTDKVFKYTLLGLFIFSVLALLISIGFLIFGAMHQHENPDQENKYLAFLPFGASLVGLGVSGFFYIYSKKKL